MKERRLWYFPCEGCGKRRAQSHKKKNATDGLCARCRIKPPEQNASLFDALENTPEGLVTPEQKERVENGEIDGVVHGVPFKVVDTPPGHPMHRPIVISFNMAVSMAKKGMVSIEQVEAAKSSEDGHLKGNFYIAKIPICQ